MREFLKTNPEVADEIEQKIRAELLPKTVKAAGDEKEAVAQEA